MKEEEIVAATAPDRSRPPRTMPLADMVWPVVEQHQIEWSGGLLPVDLIEAGGHDLVRIEWQFPVGSWHESKPLVASLTNRMLQEGSVGHSSKQIAEKLAYYGAYLHHEGGIHRSMVGVYSLGKHLEPVLPVVWELIFQPNFPAQELQTTLKNRLQELAVSLNKVSVLSRNRLMGLLFGDQHPYGYSTREGDLLAVSTEDLVDFHRCFYQAGGLRLVVAGGNTREALRKLQDSCPAELPRNAEHPQRRTFDAAPDPTGLPEWHRVEKADATQHSIRLGRRAPARTHPDYPALEVLLTLFGGYFGSRLMKNLREDKGYTYGVGAALHSRVESGWISVATEVGASVELEAREEIIHEMNRLCTETVGEEELNTVRAYLEGNLRSAFEGPFSPADRLSDVQVFGLDFGYYLRYLETLRSVQSAQLQELAATYLRPDTFTAVVAGGSVSKQ